MIGDGIDLLFCNESEACAFTESGSLSEAKDALKVIAKTFVITLGEKGAIIFDGQDYIDIEPFAVKAVDTNGAGDMYAGAFLYAITNGHDFKSAGRLASMASSQVVSQFGPRLKTEVALEIKKIVLG